MRLVFITIVTSMFAACSEPVVELEGTVNGKKGYGGAAHWGGPHVLFTSSNISCQEVDWVQGNYGGKDSVDMETADSFDALQITFRNTDVKRRSLTDAVTWFALSEFSFALGLQADSLFASIGIAGVAVGNATAADDEGDLAQLPHLGDGAEECERLHSRGL